MLKSLDTNLIWRRGYVAEDFPLTYYQTDSGNPLPRVLKVIPAGLVPAALEGNLGPSDTASEVSITDASGNPITVSGVPTNYIECNWYRETNKLYPAQLCKGERVEFACDPAGVNWYFRPLGLDESARKSDRLAFAVSAAPTPFHALDETSCYVLSFDAPNGQIKLTTSQANGEPFGYTATINTQTGTVSLEDTPVDDYSSNNRITLDSQNNRMTAVTAEGASITLDGKCASVYTPDSMVFEAGNFVIFRSKGVQFEGRQVDENGNEITKDEDKKSTFILNNSAISIEGDTVDFSPTNGTTMETPLQCKQSVVTDAFKASIVSTGSWPLKGVPPKIDLDNRSCDDPEPNADFKAPKDGIPASRSDIVIKAIKLIAKMFGEVAANPLVGVPPGGDINDLIQLTQSLPFKNLEADE